MPLLTKGERWVSLVEVKWVGKGKLRGKLDDVQGQKRGALDWRVAGKLWEHWRDLENTLGSVQGDPFSVLPLNSTVQVAELLMRDSREQVVSRVVLSQVSGVGQEQGVNMGTTCIIWAEWVNSGAVEGPCEEGMGKAG